MARAYLRLDPEFFDRKAIDQKYPPGAIAALIGALCHAEHQPHRGRFRDVRVLKALLGPHAKWIPFLIEHRDLLNKRGALYVDGWDEWQEGDWKVGERVKRIRNRAKGDFGEPDVTVGVTPAVTVGVTVETVANESVPTDSPVTVETVYNLSDGGRQSVIDSAGGKRSKKVPSPLSAGRNGAEPTLSKAELDSWRTFGPEWDSFRHAWLARGFRFAPTGDPSGDDSSQRGLLYQILDARPTDLVRWVREAPTASRHPTDVISYVLARWHDVRAEAGLDEDGGGGESGPSKTEAAESLAKILAGM